MTTKQYALPGHFYVDMEGFTKLLKEGVAFIVEGSYSLMNGVRAPFFHMGVEGDRDFEVTYNPETALWEFREVFPGG